MDEPLALYRRYRPDSFGQVIGQDHVTEPLRAALRNNRVNHAYLFSGPRGCGKTTSARILARALNCAAGPTDEPCGACPSCVELATGGPGSVDVIEIDAASHGGVDDARELREQASFRPMRDRYKIYIIDEAHMVTTQGFNALLKIVEEPPEHVRFIFATTEPEKVIGTVRSRTHHYPFRLIPPRVLSAYLAELCDKESVAIDPAALPLVVRAGGGSARDSLSVLDQLMGGAPDGKVTHELAAGLLGFTPATLLDEVVDAFAAQDASGVFGAVDKVVETGQDPRRFTEDLLHRFRDLVILSAVPDATSTGLIDVPDDVAERLVAQAARFGRHDLTRAADLVAEGLTELKGTSAPRLLLELMCARILLPGSDDTARGLGARMDRLEKRLAMAPPSEAAGPPPSAPPRSTPPPAAVAAPPPPVQPAPPPPAAPPAAPPPAPPAARDVAPTAPVAEPAPAAEAAPAAPAPDAAAAFGIADVRRLWPDILESLKQQTGGRVPWMMLAQHAQVMGIQGTTVTVGFNNVGARDTFINKGGAERVRQLVINLIGQDWTFDVILDPSIQPGAHPAATVTRPAVRREPEPPAPEPSEGEGPDWARADAALAQPGRPPQETAVRSAREAIQPTREAGAPPAREQQGPLDSDAHPDDPAVEDDGLSGAELLTERLGASVIEEIPHT